MGRRLVGLLKMKRAWTVLRKPPQSDLENGLGHPEEVTKASASDLVCTLEDSPYYVHRVE